MSNEVTQKVLYMRCNDAATRQNNADKLNEMISKGWTVDEIVHGQHIDMSYMYVIVSKKEKKPNTGIQ